MQYVKNDVFIVCWWHDDMKYKEEDYENMFDKFEKGFNSFNFDDNDGNKIKVCYGELEE